MSREQADQERPCLHCMMVQLIDDFFAEYPATSGSDKVDTAEADEVIEAGREDSRRDDEPAGWHDSAASDRAFDATDNALRWRVSP